MKIDFSIVTASYNYGHFIGECLDSVAAQRGVTFEHIVIDACSKDNTALVVAERPHTQFIQEPDQGMSDGINKGFRRAKGKWVMWLNADDRLKSGALHAVKKFAEEQSNADVIYGAWDFINGDGSFQRRMGLFPFRKQMLIQHGCYIGSTSCFYRRSSTIDEGYMLDLDFHYCMDGEYYARLATAGKKFAYLPEVLADFRLHDASISQSNIGSRDLGGILKMQKQIAEVRAVRRAYGWNYGPLREIEDIADGVFALAFQFQRFVLKKIHSGKLKLPDKL